MKIYHLTRDTFHDALRGQPIKFRFKDLQWPVSNNKQKDQREKKVPPKHKQNIPK